jgi:hypothetical protein
LTDDGKSLAAIAAETVAGEILVRKLAVWSEGGAAAE